MDPQETTAEKQALIQKKISEVAHNPNRTDGGSKFKKLPPEAADALKKQKKAPIPRKVQKKRKKQEDKNKPKPPPFCRYIEGIECIYAGVKWAGIADELKTRDKLDRPMQKKDAIRSFCKDTCLAHVMGKHQVTSMFGMGVTFSKQLAQIQGALNIIAGQNQPLPKVPERKHPSAPSTSLRTLASQPDKITKKTE